MTTIQHYSAETARTTLLYHAVRAFEYPRTLARGHTLLWNFFRRQLLGRFRGSLLGIFWVLVQPIFLFCVYFAIFGILFAPRDALAAGGPDPGFALYLFGGLILFHALTEATSNALSSITGAANLVKKVRFPCEMLPLVPVLVAASVYVVGCVVIVLVGVPLGQVSITPRLLAWPILLVLFVSFATGLGLLLASANVFIRDVSHLFRIGTTAWFFLTPNFWRFDMVASKFDAIGIGWVRYVLMANPAMPFVMAQRQVFGIGDTLPPDTYAVTFPLSLAGNLLLAGFWAALVMFLGYGFFKSRRHKFADLV